MCYSLPSSLVGFRDEIKSSIPDAMTVISVIQTLGTLFLLLLKDGLFF